MYRHYRQTFRREDNPGWDMRISRLRSLRPDSAVNVHTWIDHSELTQWRTGWGAYQVAFFHDKTAAVDIWAPEATLNLELYEYQNCLNILFPNPGDGERVGDVMDLEQALRAGRKWFHENRLPTDEEARAWFDTEEYLSSLERRRSR